MSAAVAAPAGGSGSIAGLVPATDERPLSNFVNPLLTDMYQVRADAATTVQGATVPNFLPFEPSTDAPDSSSPPPADHDDLRVLEVGQARPARRV